MPKRSLQKQLLFSHLALVALMVVLMVGAVVDFLRLSGKIDRILKDNYASVVVVQFMKEALARLDSAAALELSGNRELAQREIAHQTQIFDRNFYVESHNITEIGEQELVNKIEHEWKSYRGGLDLLFLMDLPRQRIKARALVINELKPANAQLTADSQAVLDLNESAIRRADSAARIAARRSAWTGAGFTAAAVLLAVFYVRRIVTTVLSPIRKLARHAEEVRAGNLGQTVEVEHEDEIGVLAESFNRMTLSLLDAHKREEERFHRAERMSAVALRNLYDPVIVTDGSGVIVHWNLAAEGLFGTVEDAKGRPIKQVISDKRISEAVDRAIHHERTSASEDETGLVTFKSGESERTYRLRATPMLDENGLLIGSVAVLEDITHMRALDRLKTEFIGVASHELRTPVTSLLLSVQLLEEGAAGVLTAGQHEIVAAQKDDLQRLDRMMRDLLDITRLEAGVMPPRMTLILIEPIIESAIESIRTTADAKNISLVLDVSRDLPEIRADQEQVTRLLINLLNNACRHTPVGGQIRVEATIVNDVIEISVSDTGAGIPQDYLERIFDRFVQVPGATRGGAGLGLSIARSIARAHGGDIQAASVPGKGSDFTLTLPLTSSTMSKVMAGG